MTVEELILLAVDNVENVTVDQAIRAVRNVIRDINGSFRGLHKSLKVIEDNVLFNGYMPDNRQLTGTVIRQAAPNADDVVGTNTLFTTELTSGNTVIIDNTLYIVGVITDDTNMTINRAEGVVDAEGLQFYLVNDIKKIVLTGLEKTLLRVFVDGHQCKEVKAFNRMGEEDYAYMRTDYNQLAFNYIPDDHRIVIEALYGLKNISLRTDVIDMPLAWDGVLTNGLLFYLTKNIRHRNADIASEQAALYYQMLANLATNTDVSILGDYQSWNYSTLRKE